MVVAVVLKVEGFAGPGGGDDGDAARVGHVGRERDGAGEADVGEAPSLAGVRQRRRRRAVVVGSAGVAHGMSGVVDRDRWNCGKVLCTLSSSSLRFLVSTTGVQASRVICLHMCEPRRLRESHTVS